MDSLLNRIKKAKEETTNRCHNCGHWEYYDTVVPPMKTVKSYGVCDACEVITDKDYLCTHHDKRRIL